MGVSEVKQAKCSQKACTFCCISNTVKAKFINEGVTFCTLFVQVCVTEAETNFYISGGFVILLVTAVCLFPSPGELRPCDGLKSCSCFGITQLIAVLGFCKSCFAMSWLCLGLKEQRNKGFGELLFGRFCIIYGEILIAPSVICNIFFSSDNGKGGQHKRTFLMYHTI